MSGIFDRFRGGRKVGSGSMAKERLQFILVHDRINLPPERLDEMKAEILAVISKYVSVESDKVDIALQQRDRNNLLIAEIPFSEQGEDAEIIRELPDIEHTSDEPSDKINESDSAPSDKEEIASDENTD